MADTPKLNPSDRSVEAYEKINQSIEHSNSAKTAADNANTTADEAKQIAESSNTKSVRTQEQLDQVVIEGDSSVEAAQARVDTDGVSHQTLKERLDDEHTELTTQLAENAGVKCTSLGMAINDDTKAKENTDIITQALKDGKKILVDGVFYLRPPDTGDYLLDNIDILIKGITVNAEFIVKTDGSSYGSLFNVYQNIGSVEFYNMKFANNENDTNTIITFGSTTVGGLRDWFCPKISVENCIFEGNIGLIYGKSDESLNPLENKIGFVTFEFTKNQIKNSQNLSFINLFDTPCTRFVIKDNNITNFHNKFFGVTVSNGITFEKEFFESIKLLIADNNKVICEDNWFGTASGGYYCFVLFEGTKAIYTNNHVEGIKTTDNVPVYDSYINCDDLTYKNNLWKNNLCFASGKVNNTLLKSKGGSGNGKIKRLYKGNDFIIEKSFIENVGQSLSNGWVSFIDVDMLIDTYEITENNFDIYHLKFSGNTDATSLPYFNYIFESNKMNIDIAEGVLFQPAVSANTDYSKAVQRIKNNIISVNTQDSFFLIAQWDRSNGANTFPSLVVEGNTIKGALWVIITRLYVDELVFSNNNFDLDANGSDHLIVGQGTIKKLRSLNNMFSSPSGTTYNQYNHSRKFNSVLEDNTFIKDLSNGNNEDGIHLSLNAKESKLIRYFVEAEILFPEGWQKMDFTFDYGYDSTEDANYIEFTDTSDTLVKRYLYSGDAEAYLHIKVNNKTSITTAYARISDYSGGQIVNITVGPNDAITHGIIKQKVSTMFI